jgi:hypothetical protein
MTRNDTNTKGTTMGKKIGKLISRGYEAECKGQVEKASNLYRQAQDLARPLSPEWTVARTAARRVEG